MYIWPYRCQNAPNSPPTGTSRHVTVSNTEQFKARCSCLASFALQWVREGKSICSAAIYFNFYSIKAKTNYVEEIKLAEMKELFLTFYCLTQAHWFMEGVKTKQKKSIFSVVFFSDYLTFASIWVAINTFVSACDKCCFSWTQTRWQLFFAFTVLTARVVHLRQRHDVAAFAIVCSKNTMTPVSQQPKEQNVPIENW